MTESNLAVVCCHPWGPLGGSMHDPVVAAALYPFSKAGHTTCRFNFRSGIGTGKGSMEDVAGVVRCPYVRMHEAT